MYKNIKTLDYQHDTVFNRVQIITFAKFNEKTDS